MTAKTPPPEEELARLRAEVQQLQAEVARKERELADQAERTAEDLRRDADRRYRPADSRGDRDPDRDRGTRPAQGARDDRNRGVSGRYQTSDRREREERRERDDSRRAEPFRDDDRRYDAPGYDRDRDRDDRSDARRETRRVASDASDTTWRKSEIATRAIRGATLASLDALRLFADSLSWLADGALRRNRPDDRDTSVNELNRRLPSDVSASFADAVDDWIDIPARAASRFADSYFEGEYRRRDLDRDRESRRDDDRRYDRDRDEERRGRSGSEEERGFQVEFRTSRTADERPSPPPPSPSSPPPPSKP